MKKRRTLIVAFMLVAVLTIGIGYAALNDTLYVTGNAKASASAADESFDLAVYFEQPTVAADAGYTVTVGTDNLGDENDLATVAVTGLVNKDDTMTVEIPIKNDSQYAANLTLTLTEYTATYFDFDYALSASQVAAGGTVNAVITVTLLQTPTDTDFTAGFSFDVDAEAVVPTT